MSDALERLAERMPRRPSILALDLSLTGTGWCSGPMEYGCIATKHLKGYDRIAHITQTVFCKTFGVDVVVVEDFPWGVKGKAVVQLAGLREIILFWLYQHEIKTVLVNVSTLKKFATGNHQAPKTQMVSAAQHRFHLNKEVYDDNIADAYLLWAFAREAYGGPIATVPADRAALAHRLSWPALGRGAA